MKKTVRFILVLPLCLLRLNNMYAQDKPADAPIVRDYADPIFISGVKGEYYFKENSCVFYSGDYNFNKDYRYRITNSTRIYNRLGLEMNASGKWYVGASLSHRMAYDDRFNGTRIDIPNIATVKVNLTHRGNIGSIRFIKELSAEYIHHFNQTFFDTKKDLQAGIGAALYKDFKVLKRPLGFLISYKIILNSNLESDIYKDRRIDFTKMRMDVFYGITKNLYIGLFAMRETEYYYPPGTSGGVPPVNIYYKVNRINPVIGVNVNLVLQPENIKEYIPGLPFR